MNYLIVRRLLAACSIAALAALMAATVAQASNSAAAAACQQDGWQTLVRQDGTGFKNTGDCVSYAAHGGALIPKGNHLITFSEFPVGTFVTTQYASEGVIFSGTPGPRISPDFANPTTPVLSPGPGYLGTIQIEFVSPTDGTTPASVSSVEFDVGYLDSLGGVTISSYDIAGNQIASFATNQLGIQHITLGSGVHRITVVTTSDPAGAAIDNLEFSF